MRIFVALMLGGLLAMGCGDSDSGDGGDSGTGGMNTGGSGGDSGTGGGSGEPPEIISVTSTPNEGCEQGTPGDYTITIVAEDAETDPADLLYSGLAPAGCNPVGAEGPVLTWDCFNNVSYPNAIVEVEDEDGNTDDLSFTVVICEENIVLP